METKGFSHFEIDVRIWRQETSDSDVWSRSRALMGKPALVQRRVFAAAQHRERINHIREITTDIQRQLFNPLINPFNPEFTIVIFIHYKPWIAVAILDL